jgi:phosphoglycolate phosphatase-like HAD superfamily hydrolase
MKSVVYLAVAFAASLLVTEPAVRAADPLPSWTDGASRRAALAFVERTTTTGSPEFVPAAERIAVFDNDGTLWAEQPMYFQLAFAVDRVKALASQHPEWQVQEPCKSVLAGDLKAALAGGPQAVLELVTATHANTTTDEFAALVARWLARARHPTTGKPYTEMTYRPMQEVLTHLRANGFKTFIVSGGGVEFMRVFSERVYGIPPEQVIGSSIETKFERRAGSPVLMRLPKIGFVDDGPGKPVGINRAIGRRPLAAFGNSDGDLQMLQWTAAGPGRRLAVLVHHTDAEREWAYDRDSSSGRRVEARDEATANGWTVVDM